MSLHSGEPSEGNVAAPGEPYLTPYLRAAEQYGGGFSALLWASPKTQRARFDAIRRSADLDGKSVLDAGCGRADLLGFLLDRNIHPADYIGLEAVESLADAAEARAYPNSRILRADFVQEPARLFVGADVIVFSGSLNTMDESAFYETLRRAYDATAGAVVFNFLSSPALAGKEYLIWHRPEKVEAFARRVADEVRILDDYIQGDCTIAMEKKSA
jgi:SAM-dependent methyltransferase